VLVYRLTPGLPAFPVFRKPHTFFASGVKAFGPLFGRCRAATESVVEFVGNVVDVLLVVVLCNFDVGWSCRRLEQVSGDVVLVVGEKGEGQSRPQGRGSRKEKARVLGSQSRLAE
jgi:hypothetical protein